MSILAFIIAGAFGLFMTSYTLWRAQKSRKLSYHFHALIVASGLGLTWGLAFFMPILVPSSNIEIDVNLVIFGLGLSLFIFFITYFIVRIMLMIRKKI